MTKRQQRSLMEIMDEALRSVSEYYDSDYAYYVEKKNDDILTIYEWANLSLPLMREKIKLSKSRGDTPRWLLEEVIEPTEENNSVFLRLEEGKTGVLAVVGTRREDYSMALLDSLLPLMAEVAFLVKEQKAYEFLSYHDQMTGLLNRNSYLDTIADLSQEKVREGLKSLGVVSVNLNSLKELNKEFGRDYGDELITRVAEVLEEFFKGDQVFRFGGDEFLIIAKNLPYEKFMGKIHKSQKFIEGISLDLVAIGYSWERKEIQPEKIVAKAEDMMQKEKANYKSRKKKGRHVPVIKNDLLEDIEQGNFIVCLIPKFDARSQRIVGAEAVVRYQHKMLGVLHPEKYIKLLEDTNLSSYLDLHIFEEVCKTIKRWERDAVPLLPIGVNFSPVALRKQDIAEEMIKIIEKHRISCEYLEIEMLGSASDLNQEMLAEISRKLRKVNLRVTLDHFGGKDTCVSTLSLLEFDSLKLDSSLVEDIVGNTRTQVIAKGIIDICHQLGATVAADGVEIIDQLNILREYGCDVVQGTYYNKPITIETFQVRYLQG